MNNSHFELILERVSDEAYKATTPLFPRCKGQGLTKEEAIEKLCSSISRHISKSTKFFLKDVFNSKKYSEVITDPDQKEKFQHRVISLDKAGNASQNVFFKTMSLDEMLSKYKKSPSFKTPSFFDGADQKNEPKIEDDSDQLLRFQICLN